MAVSVCCLTHPLFGNFGVEIQTDQDCSPSLFSPIKTTPIWHWLLYSSRREGWVRCRVWCWSYLLLYSYFNQTKCYTIAPNLLSFEFTCSLSSVLVMLLHSLPCWPCFLHHLLPIQNTLFSSPSFWSSSAQILEQQPASHSTLKSKFPSTERLYLSGLRRFLVPTYLVIGQAFSNFLASNRNTFINSN